MCARSPSQFVLCKKMFFDVIFQSLGGQVGLWGLAGQCVPIINMTCQVLSLPPTDLGKPVSFQAPHALASCVKEFAI